MVIVENEIKQWGNSLGLVIPSEAVRKLHLIKGEVVEVDIKKKKKINAFGLCKGARSFKEEEEPHKEFGD